VTKINAGKITYLMESFNFGELVDEAVESIRLMPLQHLIVLENNAYVDYVGDYYRLEQVLNNLISNAVKYSSRGSQILVTSALKDDSIIVSIRDFGIGIAKENIDRLFDRYFRVENNSMLYDGLGLGLFISSEIIKRHGGRIWTESELGKGSTFYFQLPVMPDQDAIVR
jgi:signal transduction histidine kinase